MVCFGAILSEDLAVELHFFKVMLEFLEVQTPSHHRSYQQFQHFSNLPFTLMF